MVVKGGLETRRIELEFFWFGFLLEDFVNLVLVGSCAYWNLRCGPGPNTP